MIAQIVLNRGAHATDCTYDYLIPEDMNITIGMRVEVPFGFGNKSEEGYVVGISDNSNYKKIKSIIRPVDDFCAFDEKGVELVEFMHHRYFCRYAEAIKCLLPPNVNTKFKSVFSLNEDISIEKMPIISHSVVLEKIVELLKENGDMSFDDISGAHKGKNV